MRYVNSLRSRKIGLLAVVAVALALVISVALAATSRAAGSGSGGTLIIGMTASAIPALDTVEAGGEGYEGDRFVGNQLYDGLTRYDLDSSTGVPAVVPDLASSWKVNKSATVWTFDLRKGVKFTDGSSWNAAAAQFNFERYLDPKDKYTTPTLVGLAATYDSAIKSTKVTGPMTIKVTLKGPDAHFPEDITTLYMASPTAVKKYGATGFGSHPVGTGPFKYQSEVTGQTLTLVPNKGYWRGAPKLTELVPKPIPDVAQRIAALRSGQVNWIEYPNPNDIAGLKSAGFQVDQNAYDHIWTWVLDSSSGPTKDVRVRQALNYAID